MKQICLALLLLLAPPAAAAAQLAPDAEWHTLDTEHFRVHFTAGLEPVARRAADRAETAYAELAEALVDPPRGRVELVIADNVDYANGYATPLPSNRIVIYAHPPVDTPSLAFYDDWLELVITHELTHIFHLDYARGIWRPLRAVFGRSPLLFPQLWSPGWLTEGLATHMESRLTGAGRVRGTMHEMALRTAVLQDAFFDLDRLASISVTWPAGNTRYVYGSLFVDHLAERFGTASVSRFVERVGAAALPGRLNDAAKRSFGVTFDSAWTVWEAELRTRYLAQADSLRVGGLTEPELLTKEGRYALFPRWAPDGTTVAYAASTGREEAATRLLLGGGREKVLARRSSLGPGSWTAEGDALVLAQFEFRDPYHLFADLYRVTRSGEESRLTRGARLLEPDVAPDGRRVVAIDAAGGTNAPIVFDMDTGEQRRLREPELDTHWSLPRWSPDGSRIAVSRWRAGGFYDVVLLDSTGTVVRELTRDRAVDNAPAWSPDGRYVVFSSDRTGIANLFAYDLRTDSLRQVTNVLTGVFQPDVSPDGRSVVFSLYAADGYHIARLPWDPATWRPAPPVRAAVAAPEPPPERFAATAGGPARPYRPWRSLVPTAWTPLVATDQALGTSVGAAVYGSDVVGRHAYSAVVQLYAEGRASGGLAYRYAGWGMPVLDAVAEQGWTASLLRVEDEEGAAANVSLLRRERTLGIGGTLLRRRVRATQYLSAGVDVRDRRYEVENGVAPLPARLDDFPLDVGAVLAVGHSTVRGYEFSISPEDGFAASASVQGRRYTRPLAGDESASGYLRFTGRGRAFRGFRAGGFARHVLAARLDAGADLGSRVSLFDVGGASNGPGALPFGVDVELGTTLAYPVRGYPQGAQRGDRAVSASVEYRLPLALVEGRLPGIPLPVDRVWGDLFADAGTAWCAERCEPAFGAPASPDPLVSAGAELAVELGLVALRGGVALPLRDASNAAGGGARLYLRLGRSF